MTIHHFDNKPMMYDERIQTEISSIKNSLEKISKLRGIHCTNVNTNEMTIGVLAQEVEEVFPEAIVTTENGLKLVVSGVLLGPIIEAIKELKTRVEQIEDELYGEDDYYYE